MGPIFKPCYNKWCYKEVCEYLFVFTPTITPINGHLGDCPKMVLKVIFGQSRGWSLYRTCTVCIWLTRMNFNPYRRHPAFWRFFYIKNRKRGVPFIKKRFCNEMLQYQNNTSLVRHCLPLIILSMPWSPTISS